VVPYKLPDSSRTTLAVGFDPSGAPPKLCSTVSVPVVSSLKTSPQPKWIKLSESLRRR
jgi:hypothetical protein